MSGPGTLPCPGCGMELALDVEAMLPEQTDITLTLHIEPGQLCMAKTVAGVIENFAAMQEEVAKALDCQVSVFMAGLKYEDDVIYLTFRMANAAKGKVGNETDRAASGTLTEGGDVQQAPGDSLSGPTGNAGDAQ